MGRVSWEREGKGPGTEPRGEANGELRAHVGHGRASELGNCRRAGSQPTSGLSGLRSFENVTHPP